MQTDRQFAWLEVSLIYDKSDQHQTIYDSYGAELAATQIQSLTLKTGRLVYGIDNEDDKHRLYAMFVAFFCDGCFTAPLTEYTNNEICQELPKERNSFTNTDKKLYIDIRRSKGYTDELEKLTRDDSDLNLTVKLKKTA